MASKKTSHKGVKHGECGTKEYEAWRSMKKRVLNTNAPRYPCYGGRGITICKRWLTSYINFKTDMGAAPAKEYSLDRINNNGNYTPSNCRWATIKQQNDNKTKTIRIRYKGLTMTPREWANTPQLKDLGVTASMIRYRMRQGWSTRDTLERPSLRAGKSNYGKLYGKVSLSPRTKRQSASSRSREAG